VPTGQTLPPHAVSPQTATLGSLEDLLHARSFCALFWKKWLLPSIAPNGCSSLRWRGGALTELELSLPHSQPHGIRTDEDTLSLLRRLAAHYSDVIAGILNRQGRKTANGERFTANQVGGLRRYRNIPRYGPPAEAPTGELVTLKDAAKILGVAASTIHRWINDGFIAGEQITPGAPWRIRMTDELRACFVEETPPQFLSMLETTMKLGVTRQTVLQRVKRGELEAVPLRFTNPSPRSRW
jgi:predicted DNA-binding transcriptional regulator AlpA